MDQDGAGGVSLGFAAQPSACRPFRHAVDLLQGSTLLTAIQPRVVVAACVIEDGAVLAARRTGPPELAGKWELPGGKVEPGETDEQAVRRELAEELRVDAIVGGRIGHDVDLGDNTILRTGSSWRVPVRYRPSTTSPAGWLPWSWKKSIGCQRIGTCSATFDWL